MNFSQNPTNNTETRTAPESAEAGFSLVEVMVALFVFALLSTGTAYTVLNVMQLDRDSRARHIAVNLAAQEIDLARDTADLLALVDVERPTHRVGGTAFHVRVMTAWVSATGTDDACGATGGTLLTKRVNVEVRWDNQRAGSAPVQADTVITPNAHLNSPDRGTILARVLGASGSGVPGVRISVAPAAVANGARSSASAVTDAQGCAFVSGLTPGNYDVTASASNHIGSQAQETAPVVTVPLVAGYSAGASFSYDRASRFELSFAPVAVTPVTPPATNPPATNPPAGTPPAVAPSAPPAPVVAPTVYLPRNLDTSYLTDEGGVHVTSLAGGGSATNTTRTRTVQLFPFPSGYEVVAGRYAPLASCLSVDPAAWAPVTEGGVTLTGSRTRVASEPGATAFGSVPMGIVTVSALTAGSSLTAVSAAAPVGSGDPGCTRTTTYDFGAVPAGATIALPYGSWTLRSGSATVPGSAITLGSRGRITGAVLTLDPRVGGTP